MVWGARSTCPSCPVLTLCLIDVFGCRRAVEGLMNLPVMEDPWTVRVPLPLAILHAVDHSLSQRPRQ